MKMDTELLPGDGLILCAVSGGADSMYLLCALRELGFAVAAAHYNHGLRGGESDRDQAFVEDFCEKNAIPFRAERGDAAAFAAREKLGVEAAARTLRYAFLERTADARRSSPRPTPPTTTPRRCCCTWPGGPG